jgi:hypothetical protein
MNNNCPNFGGCRLVNTEVVEPDENRRRTFIKAYCVGEDNFKSCKRYVTKKSLWICPDFVLPDSDMTEDEIVARYEQEKEKEKE